MSTTRWTEAELNKLTDIVFTMRLNDVVAPLVTLVKAAMHQLPQERRRKIRTHVEIGPLIKKLEERFEAVKLLRVENDSLRSRLDDSNIVERHGKTVLEALTPEQRLDGLTIEQILEAVPIDKLIGETARRTVELITSRPVRELSVTEVATAKIDVQAIRRKALAKVCLVGLKGDQVRVVEKHIGQICQLKFVETGHSGQVPDGQDYYIVWTKFINHAIDGLVRRKAPIGGYVQVSGGLDAIISKIQTLLERHNG